MPNGFELTSSLGASSDLSTAIFGEAVWHMDPRVSLTVGARYTHETVNNDGYNTSGSLSLNYVNGSASIQQLLAAPVPAVSRVGPDKSVRDDFTRLQGRRRQAQPTLDGGNQVYKPETLTNYELGMKSESADKRLRLDADVFYMDWKDIQADYSIGERNPTSGSVDFIIGVANAAAARSYGFETEATALVVPGFRLGRAPATTARTT